MDDQINKDLLDIIKHGTHRQLAKQLESDGLDSDDTKDNCIALINAIITRDVCKIKLLLDYGCPVNSSGTDLFYSPLHYAIETGDNSIVNLMLYYGASMTGDPASKITTPLYKAFKKSYLDIVDLMLLNYKGKRIDVNNMQEFLHFNIACARNDESLVEKFIKEGINVNGILDAEEWNGLTPLYISVIYLSVEVVEILLKHKADFLFQDKNGQSPLHLAYYKWKNNKSTTEEIEQASDIIDLILSAHTRNINNPSNTEGLSHFHIACMGRCTTLVYYFLQSGENVNSPVYLNPKVSSARVPLHLAIENERYDIVKTLLQHEADVYKKNADGLTSIDIACKKKNYKIAELLLEYSNGASSENTKVYNSIFQAFEDYPLSGKIIDIMFVTCQEGIVNSTNKEGLSLLHIACLRNNIYVIDKLLQSTSDVNAQVYENSSKWAGYTALHFAALSQNFDAIQSLLNYKADVNIVEEKGLTPIWLLIENQPRYKKIESVINDKFESLELANIDEDQIINIVSQELKHIEVVELLAKNKSNLNYRNNNGDPLLMAVYESFVNRFLNERRLSEVILSKICEKYFQNSARKVFNILIENGIDLHILDYLSNNIFHYIVRSTKNYKCKTLAMEVAEVILKNGFCVNFSDLDYNTSLHLAIQYESLDLIEIILRYNPDLDASNKVGCTPLINAVLLCCGNKTDFNVVYLWNNPKDSYLRPSLKILERLLNTNCNVNAQLISGETSLFIAALARDLDCVKLLLNYGADINIKKYRCNSLMEKVSSEYELTNFKDDMYFNILKVLIWHTLKLIMIGHFVDERNLLRCQRYGDQFKFYYRKILICEEKVNDSKIPKEYTASLREELDKLKNVNIDQYTSLYDILFKNEQQMTKHVKNDILKKYVCSETLFTDYPNYGYLLRLKFRDGLNRNLILEQTNKSFQCLTGNKLPASCVDGIFNNFTNEDMKNLALAKP